MSRVVGRCDDEQLRVVVHLIRVREVQIEEHSDPRDARAAWRATHHEDLRAHLEAPGAWRARAHERRGARCLSRLLACLCKR